MADVFNWMETRAARAAKRPLDVQSRGRNLSERENAFAEALENIFATGVSDMAVVAEELTAARVEIPSAGKRIWTISIVQDELEAINVSLDAAYNEDGYGA